MLKAWIVVGLVAGVASATVAQAPPAQVARAEFVCRALLGETRRDTSIVESRIGTSSWWISTSNGRYHLTIDAAGFRLSRGTRGIDRSLPRTFLRAEKAIEHARRWTAKLKLAFTFGPPTVLPPRRWRPDAEPNLESVTVFYPQRFPRDPLLDDLAGVWFTLDSRTGMLMEYIERLHPGPSAMHRPPTGPILGIRDPAASVASWAPPPSEKEATERSRAKARRFIDALSNSGRTRSGSKEKQPPTARFSISATPTSFQASRVFVPATSVGRGAGFDLERLKSRIADAVRATFAEWKSTGLDEIEVGLVPPAAAPTLDGQGYVYRWPLEAHGIRFENELFGLTVRVNLNGVLRTVRYDVPSRYPAEVKPKLTEQQAREIGASAWGFPVSSISSCELGWRDRWTAAGPKFSLRYGVVSSFRIPWSFKVQAVTAVDAVTGEVRSPALTMFGPDFPLRTYDPRAQAFSRAIRTPSWPSEVLSGSWRRAGGG